MFGMLLLYFMKFATDVLLLAPSAIGLILGISRVWDAVSDPIAGYWSDGTKTRIGRRRPWILGASLPIAIAFIALWSPPASLEGMGLVWWSTIWIFLFFSAYTAYAVPYKALGAELGAGYHDRTRVFASSSFLGFFGAFFAIGAVYTMERAEDPRATAVTLASIAASITFCAMLFAAIRLREHPGHIGRGSDRGIAAFGDVFRNRYAQPLLGVHFLSDLGGASFAAMLPYVSDYILKTPGYTAFYQLALLVGITVGIPIWVPLSRRYGKREVWLVATALQIPFILTYPFLRQGDWLLLLIGMFIVGLLNACSPAVAPSMQTDVIDVDEYESGERKEGVYFATWNLVQKSAFGINLAMVGLILDWSGFVANVGQSETTRAAIGMAFAGLPFFAVSANIFLLSRYRLSEKLHREVSDKLARRAELSEAI